jgi:response regulator of citrate/malate metabolism
MGTGSQSGSYHTDNNKGINTKVTDKEICTGVKKEQSTSLTAKRFISSSGCMRSPGRKYIIGYTP